MQVKDLMITDVKTVTRNDTVDATVTLMSSEDLGAVPVVDQGKLVGLVSDRDITTRLVAQQRDPASTPVSAVLSDQLHYCKADDDIVETYHRMGTLHVLYLPVVDDSEQLIGLVSARDLSRKAGQSGTKTADRENGQLDEALDETFPASDPISPA